MLRRHILLMFLLSGGVPVPASIAATGMVTEVIDVGYRPVEEMIAILRPLVPKPGSVSGAYGKIVIRTTPENMRDIKQILATLDRAPANLLVSVRHSMNDEVRRDLYEVFGEVGGRDVSVSAGHDAGTGRGVVISHEGAGESAGVRIDKTQSASSGGATQRVRVLEGKEAFIRTGQSVPFTEERVVVSGSGVTTVQKSTGFRNVDSGFYVRARLGGDDRVTVEIFPQNNRLNTQSGSIDVREASTVVSSRLGRWMEIGGVSGTSDESSRGIGSSSSASTRGDYTTYLKVERLDR